MATHKTDILQAASSEYIADRFQSVPTDTGFMLFFRE
jgi:hypothetical protein